MEIMNYIGTLFTGSLSGMSNLTVYLAIIVLFILGLLRCVAPVMRTQGLLKRAIRSIRSEGDKYAWQEDGFLGHGTLFAHWSEYLNNLFFADGRYHNASNVEDYINEETVIYGPGRAAFAEALPGLMTSLGFLGTLVGLTQGLSGFNMTDSASVQQSIVTLIPGMRYAFTTSIFGVIGSVLFTLITRAVYGATEHTLTQFYGAMSRHAGVLSVDPMTQIAIYQQEQTQLIKSMAKEVNGKLSEAMKQAITESIDPLNRTMQGFVNGISREQARLMDAVIDRFVGRLNETLSGSLRRYSQVLDDTSRLQQQNCDAVRESMKGVGGMFDDLKLMREVVRELMDGISQYSDKLARARSDADEANTRIQGTIEQMQLVSKQQANYLTTIGALQSDLARSNENMERALADFLKRASEASASTSDAMRDAASELRDAADKLTDVHRQAVKAIGEELDSTLESYRDYVNQFTQRVDYLSSGIAGALEKMPDAVSEANDRLLDQADALADAMERAQNALNDAVDRLYGRR